MCQNALKVSRLTEKFNELRYSGPSLVLLGPISTNSAANTTEPHFYKTRQIFKNFTAVKGGGQIWSQSILTNAEFYKISESLLRTQSLISFWKL